MAVATPGVEPGAFHRLGIAINQGDGDPAAWFADVLGAAVQPSFAEPGDEHLTTMVALGTMQFAVFAAPGPEGMIGRFVERHGAGLHSLAWRVDDMWVTENVLRARGITITGANIDARHFFMHPRETFGILIEWTDQGQEILGTDARAGLAWITSVVRDCPAAVAFFEDLCGATRVAGLPAGPREVEETTDLAIGDVVIRLVSPRSDESRYAPFLAQVGERLHSFALRVDDLAFPSDAGLAITDRDDARVWTDPAATLGLRIEWVS
jgi:catechol 2,3-dioxygenase-like lactoylglutathione lyase family enzyme